ncbi:MAG: hypothetical protein GXO17_06025 [Thermodesulfobacteria bacterium]|nr:hypothetical protein [Thermodesulfobacteriota bacterium]
METNLYCEWDQEQVHRQEEKRPDFSFQDLSGRDFSRANLRGAKFFKAKLKGAIFSGADISGADFSGADLSEAHLEGVKARATGFGMANLKGARLFHADLRDSSFTKANMEHVDARCADLTNARLREANLRTADFTSAVLKEADLSLSDVHGAVFFNADLRGSRLRMLRGYKKASWIGADIRDINFAGAYLLRRHIMDENYLEEFKNQGPLARVVYYLWWLTSDCGRSMFRWCLLILAQALFFAYLYHLVGVDYGKYPTALSPLYYSIVTLTTLGYGDVIPNSLAGQVIAICEVITGYVMLGGLLAIFTNRIARRAD